MINRLAGTKTPLEKIAKPLASSYDPKLVETGWQKYWENLPKQNKKQCNDVYSMVLPPPNVTGVLHIGHALTLTIQDALARWNRMKGKYVVWIPGLDHAGIATQTVVEKKLLQATNQSRHDVGRDAFVQHVWSWYENHGGQIQEQMKRMGAMLDWDKEVFTLDEARSRAVVEAFVRLHEEGLVYRQRKMINWYVRTYARTHV